LVRSSTLSFQSSANGGIHIACLTTRMPGLNHAASIISR
jgi:hypothetical protein